MAFERYDIFDPRVGLDAWLRKDGAELSLPELNDPGVNLTGPTAAGSSAVSVNDTPFPESAAMQNPVTRASSPADVLSGQEVGAILAFGKRDFADFTTEGWIQGLDNNDGVYKWLLGSEQAYMDFGVSRANTLSITTTTAPSATNALFITANGNNAWPAVDIRRSVGTGSGLYIECASPSGYCLDLLQNSNTPALHIISAGTGSSVVPIQLQNNTATSTNYWEIAEYRGSSTPSVAVSQWVGTTSPNGTLTGSAGDILQSDDGKLYICTSGTTWVEVVANASGSVSAGLGIYGDGSDGDVTLNGGSNTLTKDMYYDDLTVSGDGTATTLNAHGYRIFVKGTLTIGANGVISYTGTSGSAGTAASGKTQGTGGAGGAAVTTGTLYGSLAGKTGGNGANGGANPGTAGSAGTAGDNQTISMITASLVLGDGGAGGTGGDAGPDPGAGGAGGVTGTNTAATAFNPRQSVLAIQMEEANSGGRLRGGAGAGSGGGGGAGGNGSVNEGGGGGGGGGSGSGGGVGLICAKTISNAGGIWANGGNGGNGGAGAVFASDGGGGGGGGGGAGGHGGVLVLIYDTYSGAGSKTANGGTGGTGGTAGQGTTPGSSGSNGEAGNPGIVIELAQT